MNPTDPSNSNKRAREEEDLSSSLLLSTEKGKRPEAPKYGTKEYWEARYRSHIPGVLTATSVDGNNQGTAGGVEVGRSADNDDEYILDGVLLSKEAIKPGHEWYFTYDELRPLILPLILEDPKQSNIIEEGEFDADDSDAESWEEVEDDCGEEEEGGGNDEALTEDNNQEDEADIDGEDDKDKDDIDKPQRTANNEEKESNDHVKITKDANTAFPWAGDIEGSTESNNNKPKRILEVGCGDKPLGTSLASDLEKISSDTGCAAQCIVEEVTCIDYSEIVIKSLAEKQSEEQKQKDQDKKQSSSTDVDTQQQSQNNNSKQVKLSFQAIDARTLPYPANTYDLILEKGTLDAMLSDEEEGIPNCIKIVKEMARVTSEGGAILVVSHLNANESKGMGWLEDVVFQGLKDEFLERHGLLKSNGDIRVVKKARNTSDGTAAICMEKEYVWSVEVHGGDCKLMDANGEEMEEPDDDAIPIYGPAVYILRKKSVPASIARELFGKKKKKSDSSGNLKDTGGSEKEGNANNKEGSNEDEDEEEDELVEMPPVKLSFITYGED